MSHARDSGFLPVSNQALGWRCIRMLLKVRPEHPIKSHFHINVALLAYSHGLKIVPSCRMISDVLLYLVGPLSLFVAAALYILGNRKP